MKHIQLNVKYHYILNLVINLVKKCTLNADESNVDNHNCIECNEEKGYYQFLDSEKSYCYTKQEMADIHNDYYLDKEKKSLHYVIHFAKLVMAYLKKIV